MFKTIKLVSTIVIVLFSYTISIAQWSIVGSAGITGAVANHTQMVIDNNNVPYIAFADNANGDKLSVKKWTGSSWSSIGTAISSSSIQYYSIAVDPNNNYLYVAYKDWSVSGKLTVKKYNGSSWSTLGNAGFTSSSVDYISTVVYSGMVLVVYKDNSKSGKATCVYYDNGNWYTLGSAGFTNTSVSYISAGVSSGGYGYVAYRDNNNKPALYEWTNNGWSYVGTASNSGCSDVSLAIDKNGTPYVAYRDWGSGSKVTVRKYTSNGWSNVGSAGITPNGAGSPQIAIDQNNNTPYVVYRDDANNQKASVMKFNGSSWSNVGNAGFSANTVDYTSLAIDDKGILYVGFKDNAVSQKATVMKYGTSSGSSTLVWNGSSNSDWNTASNWSTNSVPTDNDDISIPGSLNRYPNITNSTIIYCKEVKVENGASITINNSGATWRIYGDLKSEGSISVPKGRIEMRGSSAQTIWSSSEIEVDEFRLRNSSGCTLKGKVAVLDQYIPSSGTLSTNGLLYLRSSSTKTARIATGSGNGNYINGTVNIEQYIPGGRRAYRFFGHPFSSSIKLQQLMDDIDITGPGGTSNGFTQVAVNAPSAFWFDVTTADTSTVGYNPGWKYFTSANTESWGQYEMARIFIRGAKGQGLTSGSYTPNAVTIDMEDTVNQGNITITKPKGNNSHFVICPNPYPSQVNLRKVSRSNVGANFYVWNPYQGNRGGYTAHQFSSDYFLPAYSAFVAEVSSGNSATFYFQEGDKSSDAPASLLKGDPIVFKDSSFTVELEISDSNVFWDNLLIEFDSTANVNRDSLDMEKFYNPDLDFYTLMTDSTRLSVDVRPYENGKVIPLGITVYDPMRLKISLAKYRIPHGTSLYLYDKFLNKVALIEEGFEYWFDADPNNPASMGKDRFSIQMVDLKVTTVSNINTEERTKLTIAPNPATNSVHIYLSDAVENTPVKICDLTGRVVYQTLTKEANEHIFVSLNDVTSGVYIVAYQGKNSIITEKLIKR